MGKITVADLMTGDPISVKPETNLYECAKKMVKNHVGSLLLTDKNMLKGFISNEDIMWALVKKSKEDLSSIKAIDISPRKIATIKPSATIKEAIRKMKRLKYNRLPVVQRKDVLGMITVRDILSFNPEFYPELEEFAKIREETNKLKKIKNKTQMKEGICSECGNEDTIYKVDGMMLCSSCANSM